MIRRALLALAIATPAAAHSELRRSVPANGAALDRAPAAIELHFNERVQLTALRLRRGTEEIGLPRRAIREASVETVPLPPLPPGEYRAEWRAISADGHPVGGVIAFRVLERDRTGWDQPARESPSRLERDRDQPGRESPSRPSP
jgi:methionine-rich copper-binding protein CopC